MSNLIKVFLAVSGMTAVTFCFNYASPLFGFPTALVAPAVAESTVIGLLPSGNLAIRNPRYSGVTREGRSYELTANSAVPDVRNDGRVVLDNPFASLEVADGRRITIAGVTGVFDPKASTLTMYSVTLISASENVVRMSEALIDLRENSVTSEKPVRIKFDSYTIQASRLELRERIIVMFDGMAIQPTGVVFFAAYGVQ